MVKQENLSQCNPELISRYYDEELGQIERSQVESHILECPSCRQVLEDLKGISARYRDYLANQSAGIDGEGVERHVLGEIRRRKAPWWFKAKEALSLKKALIPATATAVMALLLFVVLRAPVPDSPSAIVSSVSGNVSSIIILEAPETHQTILWFNERPEGQGL
jgi:anti-sigma factor RsiW